MYRSVPVALWIASLSFDALAGTVVINEVHFDPPEKTRLQEFVELHNHGTAPADVSGWYLGGGIDYVFPPLTIIAPEGYLVVAESTESMLASFGITALGPFQGVLAGDGERIVLRNAEGGIEDSVDYGVGFPWPLASAGRGSSMELIDPLLDNDLGGSWRASTGSPTLPESPIVILPQRAAEWHWRRGTSEASDPPSAWRDPAFEEDASWRVGSTSIGYGDDDDATVLDDMLGAFTSVYLRRAFTVDSAAVPDWLRLRMYVDDGAIVWINGIEVGRFHVTAGEKAFDALAQGHEARWEEVVLEGASRYLVPGVNLVAVHAFNQTLSSNDFSIDLELIVPARGELPPAPSAGAPNTVRADNAPPQIRQVEHSPLQPFGGERIVVHAKVTDPDGVASVSASYQIVLPGAFIPAYLPLPHAELLGTPTKPRAENPAFEDPASWGTVAMTDDGKGVNAVAGDDLWSGEIPRQENRTLVRYRISATDRASLSVRVPYADDESLNFGLFVYDGVPPYVTTRLTVNPAGVGHAYDPEMLVSLPVYWLLTRAADLTHAIAYNGSLQIPKANEGARDAFNWEGAFVHEGIVYDHVNYRLRQANDRYGGSGKRSMRIRFHKGYHLAARDNQGRPYPTRWRTLNTGKMFDNLRVGNFGLTETLNSVLWNLTEVPAPYCHTFHLRVVDGPDEAPAGATGQYYGDFWGMFLGVEDYDNRFIEAHGMADGNLYKLKDGIFDGNLLRRNQGRHAITTDADFQNIRRNLRPERTVEWLDDHVNYDQWYPYHAIVEAIRHYDFVPADSHSKNRAWFFEPAEGTPFGLLWTLPHDADASWGPNWNSGIDYSTQAIFGLGGKPTFKQAYRNVIREIRDLLWRDDVIHPMIDDLAATIREFSSADRDRWRNAPADAGTQDFGAMDTKVRDMKNFAFVGWSGSTGPTVPAGGRAAYLDLLANAERDSTSMPATPVVTPATAGAWPIDALTFEVSAFSDPQGDETFAALEWRLAEVDPPAGPAPGEPRKLEYLALWKSPELTAFAPAVTIPTGVAREGGRYRVRARMMDTTGRWSHWSAPIEFTATAPAGTISQVANLRVTEVHYHPAGDDDLEFVEVRDIGSGPLDLSGVRFTAGIEFAFAGSAVESLAPGEHAVVVKDTRLFAHVHGTDGGRVAGQFAGRLDNGGEELELSLGNVPIQRFAFDDSWYPMTDGAGHSLVIVDETAALSRWSEKAGWRASHDPEGSPGRGDDDPPPGGFMLAGDLNGDGRLDISDPVGLLGALFLGRPDPLPCGDGTLADESNRTLLDLNADSAVDVTDAIRALAWLFQGGPPPAAGTACIRIAGCPTACPD